VEKEFKLAIAQGMATKPNFNSQGAQNKLTKEQVKDINRIAVLKTSSLML
jgi:hypothetical protein